MDPRLDAFIRAQSDEVSSLTEKQRGEQLTLAQNQQEALQAFWMYAKQEFKPGAEKLESILQPHLSDREEARKSQRRNQQLIFYLESQSPPGAGGPDTNGLRLVPPLGNLLK